MNIVCQGEWDTAAPGRYGMLAAQAAGHQQQATTQVYLFSSLLNGSKGELALLGS